MKAVSPVIPQLQAAEIGIGHNKSIPAICIENPAVPVLTRWRLTEDEKVAILLGADIVMTQLTNGKGCIPVHLQITFPREDPILVGSEDGKGQGN